MGGLDRIATVLDAIRAERGERSFSSMAGIPWQNSYTSLVTKGQDMGRLHGHCSAPTPWWGIGIHARCRPGQGTDAVAQLPVLGLNVRDNEMERAGVSGQHHAGARRRQIAVLGQAYPYTPIANPRWMIPNWSFGIREGEVRASREGAGGGGRTGVLLSHRFDVDSQAAARVPASCGAHGSYPRRTLRW